MCIALEDRRQFPAQIVNILHAAISTPCAKG